MKQQRHDEIEFSFRGKLRDILIILSLLGVGGNLVWCWQHGKEIKELRDRASTAVTQLVR